jgi:hypothetical protein
MTRWLPYTAMCEFSGELLDVSGENMNNYKIIIRKSV